MGIARTGKGDSLVKAAEAGIGYHVRTSHKHRPGEPHHDKYAGKKGQGDPWNKEKRAKQRALEREEMKAHPNDGIEEREQTYFYRDTAFLKSEERGFQRHEVPRISPAVVQAVEYQKHGGGGPVHVLVNDGVKDFYAEVADGGVVRLPRLKWDNLGRRTFKEEECIFGRTKDQIQVLGFRQFDANSMRLQQKKPWEMYSF